MADKNFVIKPGELTENYIQQVSTGNGTFDIAVKNGIKFYNGKADETGFEWDGKQSFEVVIPSVADIIQDPVRFVGTVDSTGTITYTETGKSSPVKGDLVYITADCTFQEQACEAGDMAIHDGTTWRVISGENQIQVVGTGDNTLVPGGASVSLLEVEGKYVNVAVSMPTVNIDKNAVNTISVLNGKVAVAPKYVGLSYTDAAAQDITTPMSIALPTALSNGAVTISEKVLEASNFTFNSGSFPTIAKNAEAIAVTTSHNMTIAASGNGDFVTNVTAISGITFSEGTSVDNAFGFVSGLSTSDGASFLNDIHVYDSSKDGETPDLTVWGQASATTTSFVTGLSEGADVVTGVTVGTVSLNSEGSGILTGIDNAGSDFVSGITFGNVIEDTEAKWFVKGLNTTGTDVVTDVTVGAVSLVSGNADFAENAMTSASVNGHVLSFNTGSFMRPVSLSKAADTITKGGFIKSGAKLEGATYTSKGFTTAALSQAESTITKQGLVTADMGLTQSSASYKFGKAAGSVVTPIMGYVKATPVAASVTKNGAVLENTTITANIPANAVAVGLNAGTLPTLTVATATGELHGSVDTTLSTSEVSWLAVAEAKKNVAGARTYTLTTPETSGEGVIAVGKEGEYTVDSATVTIAADTYVTNVSLS